MASILILAKPYDAALIRGVCTELEHDAQVFDQGDGAAQWVEANRPDMIVLSTRLSRGQPAEILAQIRSARQGKIVPVMLLGHAASGMDVQLALRRPLESQQIRDAFARLVGTDGAQEPAPARLAAWLALVNDGDYFSLLEVSPDATAAEVELAYRRLRREFDGGPTRSQELSQILEVLDEARRLLTDDELRQAYRGALGLAANHEPAREEREDK